MEYRLQRGRERDDQAIRLDPRLPFAYVNRGLLRRDQGDLAGALEDFDKAIELDPVYGDAYARRAGALIDKDEAPASIERGGRKAHRLIGGE